MRCDGVKIFESSICIRIRSDKEVFHIISLIVFSSNKDVAKHHVSFASSVVFTFINMHLNTH